jgi:hypothetical protein
MKAGLQWGLSALVGVLAGAASSAALLHYEAPANEVYALNVARVVNAERVVLSNGESKGKDGLSSAETELFRVNHTIRGIVSGLAGNHLVVVKQAIVSGPYKDITVSVLRQLGLPLNAPKVSMAQLMAQAPAGGYAPLSGYLDAQKLKAAQQGAAEQRELNRAKTGAALP